MKNHTVRIFRNVFLVALLVAGISGGPGDGARAADNDPDASPVIYAVSASPAKAAAGETIQVEAVFSAFDETDRASLPVAFSYEIRHRGRVLFTSPVKTTSAVNGAKSHLGINIEAAGDQGDYTVALTLTQADRSAGTEAAFSIVSTMEARRYRSEMSEKNPASVESRLLGEWELQGVAPESTASRITISREGGELAAQVSRADAETLWVKLRKTERSLTIRSKASQSGGGCWYVMEDVITFNDAMAEMPVRSRVLEGSRCVSVGKVSQSVFHRVE